MRSDIECLILHSLKACQKVINSDPHCFEMYGYDLLIDSNLKPWLLEVNASPSLTVTTPEDRALKLQVLNDVFQAALIHREWTDQVGRAGRGMHSLAEHLGREWMACNRNCRAPRRTLGPPGLLVRPPPDGSAPLSSWWMRRANGRSSGGTPRRAGPYPPDGGLPSAGRP